ncbi:class I SAM-dependent methyltransferase [Paraglaciecola aquimarina]|uniref:Class I SAM-dependent methyltransferase n=1 Tax=Paraglaciecola algarum TaxID=3050085 RepID=A0ABS9DB88_9ALTE|nr:class I SAM-dependent methyltransferase [Paraglaciecola sp. G1-23]
MSNKPYSQACENNKQPILNVLQRVFSQSKQVLEIGSGTGQHAAFFAPNLSHLVWQTSDLLANHDGIHLWLKETQAVNLRSPINFKIGQHDWPNSSLEHKGLTNAEFDAVFTANSTHIMQPHEAQQMMQLVGEHLPAEGVFCQYGPFNINGQYTSESNRVFDQHLKGQHCGGIQSIEQLQEWAVGLSLVEQNKMPANNMLLVWRK